MNFKIKQKLTAEPFKNYFICINKNISLVSWQNSVGVIYKWSFNNLNEWTKKICYDQ